jgi:hypothetical protein
MTRTVGRAESSEAGDCEAQDKEKLEEVQVGGMSNKRNWPGSSLPKVTRYVIARQDSCTFPLSSLVKHLLPGSGSHQVFYSNTTTAACPRLILPRCFFKDKSEYGACGNRIDFSCAI